MSDYDVIVISDGCPCARVPLDTIQTFPTFPEFYLSATARARALASSTTAEAASSSPDVLESVDPPGGRSTLPGSGARVLPAQSAGPVI